MCFLWSEFVVSKSSLDTLHFISTRLLACTSVYDAANKNISLYSQQFKKRDDLSTLHECPVKSLSALGSGSSLASLTFDEIGVGMRQGEETLICVSYCMGRQGAYPVSCVHEFIPFDLQAKYMYF